jgi:hypothetical protein
MAAHTTTLAAFVLAVGLLGDSVATNEICGPV